jgi:fructose-1,6-bisphosphatase I
MSGVGAPDRDPITLTRWILSEQGKHVEAKGDLTIILQSIQLACKVIANSVRKAGIAGLYGLEGAVNVQGEDVKKLDIVANDNFINALRYSKCISVMVSEEVPEPVHVEPSLAGKYSVVFDPLDGSSNIDCNVSVGSIFGIYRKDEAGPGTIGDVLQAGNKLVAAGYAMYGSSTQMVLTLGDSVNIFTLDPSMGEFILTDANVRIPEKPKTIYSINEGNWSSFDDVTKQFITRCKEAAPKPYSLRYVGSMVADVHRTLLYGGIFMYPATASAPSGKLRLLYECNPMAMIMEAAGGKATTGTTRILDVVPTSIHERQPIFLGCTRDVETIEAMYAATASGGGGDVGMEDVAPSPAKKAKVDA